MPVLDIALRGAAIAILLLMAAICLRGWKGKLSRHWDAALALSAAAYVLVSNPSLAALLGEWRILPLLAAKGTPVVFWLWSSKVFDDDFEVRPWHVVAWAGLPMLGLIPLAAPAIATISGRVLQTVSLLFVLLGLGRALKGRSDDMVEGRRRLRLVLVLLITAYIAFIIVTEAIRYGNPLHGAADVANSSSLALLAFAFGLLDLEGRRHAEDEPAPQQEGGRAVPSTPPDDAAAAALLDQLQRLMEEEKVYRQEGMGIAALATKLGVPEYRLRRLINHQMGHRNFTSFINSYRLGEAAAALADAGQSEVPVLTIALDAGFQSIGPFNRAFKAKFMVTPTEYRKSGGMPMPDSGIG